MNIQELLNIPIDDRNLQWEMDFLQSLPSAQCDFLSTEPQTGPDGWPYLLIEIKYEGEPLAKVLEWLSTRGIGLVINPQKEYPDYVLSYGMIWSHKHRGQFLGNMNLDQEKPTEPSFQKQVAYSSKSILGLPTEQALPSDVKKILRDFFRDQGVLRPRIMGISPDGVTMELAFSLESIGNPKEEEHAGIAEAIAWFLPPDYPVVLMSESGQNGFGDL